MLILVRGVPGSGKSTYAKTLVNYAIEANKHLVVNQSEHVEVLNEAQTVAN